MARLTVASFVYFLFTKYYWFEFRFRFKHSVLRILRVDNWNRQIPHYNRLSSCQVWFQLFYFFFRLIKLAYIPHPARLDSVLYSALLHFDFYLIYCYIQWARDWNAIGRVHLNLFDYTLPVTESTLYSLRYYFPI